MKAVLLDKSGKEQVIVAFTGELNRKESTLYYGGVKAAAEEKGLGFCPEDEKYLRKVLRGLKDFVLEADETMYLITESTPEKFVTRVIKPSGRRSVQMTIGRFSDPLFSAKDRLIFICLS